MNPGIRKSLENEIEILGNKIESLTLMRTHLLQQIWADDKVIAQAAQVKREKAEKEKKKWWKDNAQKVADILVPDMVVKFKGTRDGSGIRKIVEVNQCASSFNFENKRTINFQIIGRKMFYHWKTNDLQLDSLTTENGIEKLTHVQVPSGKFVSIKKLMEGKNENN